MTAPVNVGDVLAGKYQVERLLGAGGMGVVVAARHLLLGERVAIKLLLPQALAREDIVARFLREGQAAARIRSEHVTRVFDVGRLERGEPYLVMEYLEGTDLNAALSASGRLPIGVACEYLLQACEALAEAHALGIVHRDLKPSNLFLSQRADGSPLLKIIDFGISKMVLSAEPSAAGGEVTQSSMMVGSPLYMAPEQMVSSKGVDARADIWSMGVILHQVLAGSTPFSGANVMEIYDQILRGPPPLRALRGDVPERLEWAVQRCLSKNPSDRFGNIAELAFELAAFAPPHAHVSVERAARVLQVRKDAGDGGGRASMPQRTSSVAPPALGPGAGPQEGSGPSARGVPASSASGSDPAALASPAMGVTGRSWGGTQPPAWSGRARARVLAVIAGAAGVLAIVAAVGWFTVRPAAQPDAPPAASAEEPVAPQDDGGAALELAAGERPESAEGGAAEAQSRAVTSAATPLGLTAVPGATAVPGSTAALGPGATAMPGAGATAAPRPGATAMPVAASTAATGPGATVTPAPSASPPLRPSASASRGAPQRVPQRPSPRPPSQGSDLFSDPR